MLGDFYLDQIENADVLIVNKIDLVTPQELESATRQLREVNPEAELIFAEQGRVVPEALFEKRAPGLVERLMEAAPDHAHEHDHDAHASIESFVVRGSGTATRAGLERFFGQLPDRVWRAKGFLAIDGKPSLLQYSLGQLEITPASAAPAEGVVFIGQGMDRAAIEAGMALAGRP
jgi:G3E family GTPase